jgi:hypothetical protein
MSQTSPVSPSRRPTAYQFVTTADALVEPGLPLKGYRWGFDGEDGQGGWGKRFEGGPHGQDHIEALRVL